MEIGGFLKQSFIDWDERLVAVIFTKGCNFRCGYCHNPYLVVPHLMKESITIQENEIWEYLEKRKSLIDGVVITGGEPTLQKDLIPFVRKIKAMELPVKLDTNGTNPYILQQLINQKLIDCVAMDIKNILKYDAYQKVTEILSGEMFENIKASITLLKQNPIETHFRTTVLKHLHNEADIEALKKIFSLHTYKLQAYEDTNKRIENFI